MVLPLYMIGKTLGHYRIVEKIGAGGMGEVYRARDERLDRDVAVKVLPAGALADEGARKRFRKEALALSKLNHPNIATVYDFDSQEGVDFLAMEYVAGQTLSEKVAGGSLPEKEVASLGVQIAEALEEAHEHGIVHRDLKPGNIVVTPKGRVKVLDFGLAKLLYPAGAAAVTASISESRAVAGTVPYMSPEQLQAEPADARSDIFSFGAVLYEMATGQRPFREEILSRLTDAILHQPPVAPRALNGRVSPELERITLKCLEKDPENRYQSAKEIGVDLRRLGSASATATSLRAAPVRRWRPRWTAGVITALALSVFFALYVGSRRRAPGPAQPATIQSLAVLPLENFSHDPEQDYFADGMTEELITDLAQIGALRVISRTSVMHYKNTSKTLPEIARELNVDAVVEGSIERSGDRVRIRVQLIQAPTDTHLWANSYERDLRDVLALQGDVAQAIANEIKIKLTPQENTQLSSAHSVNPEAHDMYLRGRYYWNKRTEDGLRKSLKYFQGAVEKDPHYALAFAGLADSYVVLGASQYSVLAPKEAMPRAREAATEALQLDSSLAESHATLGYLKAFYDRDSRGAEQEFRRAIELSPGYATAHQWYAIFLAETERFDEGIGEIQKAETLDPLSLIISSDAGGILKFSGRYDEAIEQLRKTLEMDPNFAAAHWTLGLCYEEKKMYPDAIAEFQKAIALSGGNLSWKANLAHTYAVAGRKDEAVQILNELKDESKHHFVPGRSFALIYVGLGDNKQALAWLEKANTEGDDVKTLLKMGRQFDPLRSDPGYQDLLRRIGPSQ